MNGSEGRPMGTREAIQFLLDQQQNIRQSFEALLEQNAAQDQAIYSLATAICGILISEGVVDRVQLADLIERGARARSSDNPHELLMVFAESLRGGVEPPPPPRPKLSIIRGGGDHS